MPGCDLLDRVRPLRRVVGRLEVALVERFGHSAISLLAGTPVLVLHSRGRRTGAPRRHVLAHAADDVGSWLVVGGAAGQVRIPDWVANLRADPSAAVTVDGRRVPVRAVELTGTERAAAWARLRQVWPRIDAYERRAGRLVPVFRFTTTPADTTPR